MGILLQKFWPVPFVALLGLVIVDSGLDLHLVSMPDWWPCSLPASKREMGRPLSICSFRHCGFRVQRLVTAELPKVKARRSALHLSAFSLILLALAFLADRYPGLAILAVLFSPRARACDILRTERGTFSTSGVPGRRRGDDLGSPPRLACGTDGARARGCNPFCERQPGRGSPQFGAGTIAVGGGSCFYSGKQPAGSHQQDSDLSGESAAPWHYPCTPSPAALLYALGGKPCPAAVEQAEAEEEVTDCERFRAS